MVHLSAQQIEDYCQQKVSPAEVLQIDDHLVECAPCAALVERYFDETDGGATLLTLHAEMSAHPEHISYDQLAAYVDERLEEIDREIAESHLTLCQPCAEEMRDLKSYRVAVFSQPVAPLDSRRASAWERLTAFLRLPSLRGVSPAATVALSVAATGFVILAAVCIARYANGARGPQARTADLQASDFSSQPPLSQERPQPRAVGKAASQTETASPTPPNRIPSARAAARILIKDGRRLVSLGAGGRLAGLPPLSPADEAAVREALLTGRLARPEILQKLAGRSEALLGAETEGPAFKLLSPVAIVVATETPVLRWQPLAGAREYRVTISDSSLNEIAASGVLTGTSWTPPPLKRGVTYLWQVLARTAAGTEVMAPQPPSPLARFKVLESEVAAELATARQNFGDSHLVLSILFARAGLTAEAVRELESLRESNPNSPVIRQWLQDLTSGHEAEPRQ